MGNLRAPRGLVAITLRLPPQHRRVLEAMVNSGVAADAISALVSHAIDGLVAPGCKREWLRQVSGLRSPEVAFKHLAAVERQLARACAADDDDD